MSAVKMIPVPQLKLDLKNFRTVPQKSEAASIKSMVHLDPDRFWALCQSLLEDGFHPTENIIVLMQGQKYTVKEGNRRVGALKLLLKYVSVRDVEIPADIAKLRDDINTEWKKTTLKLPCNVYESSEKDTVNRIISRIHGKSEKAGRTSWKSMATARWSREIKGDPEPALDLAEKYLERGTNITGEQKERWAVEFPLSILEDVLKRKIHERCREESVESLVKNYPNVTHRKKLESLLKAIGMGELKFTEIRNNKNYSDPYFGPTESADEDKAKGGEAGSAEGASGSDTGDSSKAQNSTKGAARSKPASTNDSRAVKQWLRNFKPKGKGREKLVTLLKEARDLSLKTNPLCFCFLLRSMFEISAKVFAKENGIPLTNRGNELTLAELLGKCFLFLTDNRQNKEKLKRFHPSNVELSRTEGLLSVTSLNRLVHCERFALNESHIITVFFNLAPLLEGLNE